MGYANAFPNFPHFQIFFFKHMGPAYSLIPSFSFKMWRTERDLLAVQID
jgi:hypothetical protein